MSQAAKQMGLLNRSMVLIYGVVSYFIGVAGLACIITVLAGIMPFGFLRVSIPLHPIATDLLLVALWGVIHSAMARRGFKAWLTQLMPDAAERPTYVLIAGITSVLLVGWWQPIPGVIWSVENPMLAGLLWALFGFGWVYLLAATFAINHFDLFGLRQVYLNFRNQPNTPTPFVKRAMYRFTRHPIQTGVLIGVWATPLMTASQLVLSLGFTAYIFIGLRFEEKDLVAEFGESYEKYRREAGMVVPRFRGPS